MNDKQVDLLDYIKAVWRKRFFVFSTVFLVTSIAIIFSFTIPPTYRTRIEILPIYSSSGAGASGNISTLLGSFPMLGGTQTAPSLFMMYLDSNSFRARVVKALNLTALFFPNSNSSENPRFFEEACERLAGMVKVKNDRVFTQKLIIFVEGNDPEFIVKIAWQYLTELQNYISDNSLTKAKRYRFFLEEQLAKNKEETLEMGKAVASFYPQNNVSAVKAALNVPVALKAEGGIRSFKNYEEFKQKFDILQKEVNKGGVDNEVRYVRDVPYQTYLRYLVNQQQILEQSYLGLMQAYEVAKMEEAKEEPSFQILEEPLVPRFQVSPQRRKIAETTFGISLLIAICCSVLVELRRKKLKIREIFGAPQMAGS